MIKTAFAVQILLFLANLRYNSTLVSTTFSNSNEYFEYIRKYKGDNFKSNT